MYKCNLNNHVHPTVVTILFSIKLDNIPQYVGQYKTCGINIYTPLPSERKPTGPISYTQINTLIRSTTVRFL